MEKDVTETKYESSEISDHIYGRHPVLEALQVKPVSRVNKLWIQRGASGGPVDEILRLARQANVVFQWVERARLDEMAPASKHQGVVARVSEFSYCDLGEVLSGGLPSPLLLLDGVEDPHNLGAVVRNAAFFGAAAVIVPRWRSAGLSAAMVKASAGAAAKIPLVQVANSAQAILELKKKGYWVYGADSNAPPISSFSFQEPMVLVLGAEGSGLHRLVRERCDSLVSIHGSGLIASLNVSCASSVFLYILSQRKT